MSAAILNGMISGAALACMALAFSVVYLPTRIFHVALGAVFAATPFVFSALTESGLGLSLAAPAAVAFAAVLSMLIERLNHAPLERRGSSETTHFITSLGLFIVLVQLIVMIWDDAGHFLRQGIGTLWTLPFTGVEVERTRVILGLASASVVSLFLFFLHRTRMGLQLRALAQNPTESALRGVNVRGVRLRAFAISGILAGAAALLYAFDRGYNAHLGFNMVLLAVVAVIIGGRESFYGPILGGVLLGLARELSRWILSARWEDSTSFLLLALFLIFRPQGVLGRPTRVEEELSP